MYGRSLETSQTKGRYTDDHQSKEVDAHAQELELARRQQVPDEPQGLAVVQAHGDWQLEWAQAQLHIDF
jgi:hypothetical protein